MNSFQNRREDHIECPLAGLPGCTMSIDIEVYIVNSRQTEAKSFPGGIIFVFQGMLEYMGSEAELVGVIGHELSHVDRQHQLRTAKRAKMQRRRFSRGFSFDRFFKHGPFWMNQFNTSSKRQRVDRLSGCADNSLACASSLYLRADMHGWLGTSFGEPPVFLDASGGLE